MNNSLIIIVKEMCKMIEDLNHLMPLEFHLIKQYPYDFKLYAHNFRVKPQWRLCKWLWLNSLPHKVRYYLPFPKTFVCCCILETINGVKRKSNIRSSPICSSVNVRMRPKLSSCISQYNNTQPNQQSCRAVIQIL